MSVKVPEQLVSATAEGRLVPFVGSGVSRGVQCGLPTWPELLDKLSQALLGGVEADVHAADVVRGFVRLKRYSSAAEEALRGLGKHRFHEEIAKACDTRITGNQTVPQALWALQPKLVVTTNYDGVLEKANRGAKSITNDDHHGLGSLETTHQSAIWHVHGFADRPGSIILAPSEYASLYSREGASVSLPLARLREVLSRRTLLFIGFGFNDEEVLTALRDVLTLFDKAVPTSFVVLTPKDEERLAKLNLPADYNIKVVTVENYDEALVRLLTELRVRSADALEDVVVVDGLAQFNRRVALVLGARHVSAHLHADRLGEPALVAPGRTSCGCVTDQPLVAPLLEDGRFTVRLFSELLPKLDADFRAAIHDRDSMGAAGKTGSFEETVYGVPFHSMLAGLIETDGKRIGLVKVENKLPEFGCPFEANDKARLLRLISDFSPLLQHAHRWIQKRAWSEVQFIAASRGQRGATSNE
jgi:hypothetical protein